MGATQGTLFDLKELWPRFAVVWTAAVLGTKAAAAGYGKALKREKAKSRRAQRDDRRSATARNGRAPQRVLRSLALSGALGSTRTLLAPHPCPVQDLGDRREKPASQRKLGGVRSVRLLTQIVGDGERSNPAPWPQGRVCRPRSLIASRTVAFRGLAARKYTAILSIPLSHSLRGSGRLEPREATNSAVMRA